MKFLRVVIAVAMGAQRTSDAGRRPGRTGPIGFSAAAIISLPARMDPVSSIGIPVAFGAGLISFLSPCVLPLVPGYISAVAGVAPAEVRARRVLGPSLAFVASFSAIFIALGLLGQQALRGALTGPAALKVSGAIIIAMGILFVLAPFVPRMS